MINWIKTNIQGDKYIWVIAIVLSVIGLLSVYSATSLLAFQQEATQHPVEILTTAQNFLSTRSGTSVYTSTGSFSCLLSPDTAWFLNAPTQILPPRTRNTNLDIYQLTLHRSSS